MKTAEGAVDCAAPQLRDMSEPFVSAIRQALAGRTEALEGLAVGLCARGLAMRDIEDAFTAEDGERLLSRAAVSEVTERLWEEGLGRSRFQATRAERGAGRVMSPNQVDHPIGSRR